MAEDRSEGTSLSDRARSRRQRWMVWLCGLLLLLLLAGGLYCGLWWRGHGAFAERLRAIQATGCPVTVEQLDKWYQWPESGANAATLVLEAAAAYVAPPDSNASDVLQSVAQGRAAGRAEPLPDSVRVLVAEHLRANAKALGLVREAAAIKDSRYPMDVTAGVAMRLWYLGDVVNKANLLPCWEAILSAEDGDPNGAAQAVLTSLGIARSLAPEPMLLCQANRLTCQKIALMTLERVLSRTTGLSDAQLLALSEAVAGTHEPEGWTRALIGQRCLVIGLYEQPGLVEGSPRNSSWRRTVIDVYRRSQLPKDSDIVCLDLMDRLMQVRQLPLEKRMAAAKAAGIAQDARPKSDFIIHEWMPSPVAVVRWELIEIARRRTACGALAVERFRLARGFSPQTLDELVPQFLPEVPQDPFDGMPLRYKHLPRGYVIYSVGPDGLDDGGKERPPSRKGSPDTLYDIPFTVER